MNLRKKIAPIIFGLVAINCFAYDGPMIDGHAHWGDSFNEEIVLDRYAKSGVVAQIVMPRYLGVQGDWPTTDERVLEIAARHPNKIFVLAGMQRPDFTYMNWNSPDSNSQRILKEIDKKLEEKKVYGIGEVLVRHWAYANEGRTGQHAEIDKRFDTVFIRQVATIAIKHQVPVVIHMEGYPELVKEVDAVLIDTAGRLHTKQGLMDELGKVYRVAGKLGAIDEVLLVIDATTGQNGLMQAKVFSEVVPVTGVVLSKLDGTAKGGIIVAIQESLGVPVKLVGLGEGPDDLAPFDAADFVTGLLG